MGKLHAIYAWDKLAKVRSFYKMEGIFSGPEAHPGPRTLLKLAL
jgi:hypothetical protein